MSERQVVRELLENSNARDSFNVLLRIYESRGMDPALLKAWKKVFAEIDMDVYLSALEDAYIDNGFGPYAAEVLAFQKSEAGQFWLQNQEKIMSFSSDIAASFLNDAGIEDRVAEALEEILAAERERE